MKLWSKATCLILANSQTQAIKSIATLYQWPLAYFFLSLASSILDIHYQKLQVDWLVPGKGCITQMSIITTKNIASKFLNHVCETTHIISQHHGYFYETNKCHNKGTREHLSSLECKCETLGTKIIQQWRKCE